MTGRLVVLTAVNKWRSNQKATPHQPTFDVGDADGAQQIVLLQKCDRSHHYWNRIEHAST